MEGRRRNESGGMWETEEEGGSCPCLVPFQPSSLSLWGGSSPFELDPFGQQSIQTPTDPFASSDPFGGDDPFGMKSGSSVASNPFGGGGGAEFPATWKQDKTEHKS